MMQLIGLEPFSNRRRSRSNLSGALIGVRPRPAEEYNPLSSSLQALLISQPISAVLTDESEGAGDARPIQRGRCYVFDGVDDYVETSFIFGEDTTVSWTVKPSRASMHIMSDGSTANRILLYSTQVEIIIGYVTKGIPFTVSDFELAFHEYSIRRSEGVAYFSVDGVEVGSVAVAGSFTVTRIGQRAGASAIPSFQGSLVDFSASTTAGQIVHYKCDEQAGTTAYDSSGAGRHGTIINATLATFHGTQDAVSWQNDVGYSDGSGGVKIPRNEANPTQDVLGNPLQYTGRVPYNGRLVQSHCATFDGVDDYIAVPSLTGLETVVSYSGTGTPLIAPGRINCTAGTLYGVTLSNGSVYPMAEGAGTTIYDVSGNGDHGAATNTTKAAFWGQRQDTYHHNAVEGFSDGVNNFFYSENMTMPHWASFRMSKAMDGTSGGIEFTRLTATDNNINGSGILQILNAAPVGTYTISGVFRAATGGWVCLRPSNNDVFLDRVQYWFDLTYNTVGVGGVAGASFSTADAGVEAIGDGLYRCWVTFTTNAVINLSARVYLVDADGNLSVSLGTSIDAGAMQLESGVLSDYQKTDASTTVGQKIPALADGSADALGNPIGSPAGVWHNGAETKIDITGGVLSPAAVHGEWETEWSPFDARTNPKFRRTLTSDGTPIRADRFLAFDAALSGADLSSAQSYTASKEA